MHEYLLAYKIPGLVVYVNRVTWNGVKIQVGIIVSVHPGTLTKVSAN